MTPGSPLPPGRKVRVMIVDDSAVMRELLRRVLTRDPDVEVVGTASDPIIAEQRIPIDKPDVLTLDVEMPRMDGITFLERLMKTHPLPVVMLSSLTQKGAEISLRALELGAVDVLAKPKVDVEQGLRAISTEIVDRVKAAATARPRWKPAASAGAKSGEPATTPPSGTFAVSAKLRTLAPTRPAAGAGMANANVFIAIGASTGGTEAIYEVLKGFPEDAPGTVMVQHMPPGFTKAFAQRLDRTCNVRVKEAEDGDAIQTGHVLLAPGDRHMSVERSGGHWVVRLSDGPPVGYHKPAVDVLFESCARGMGASAVAVLLTGMGMDGAGGMLAMRRAGSHTVAQDEATSVVYGMPREAAARGAAESVEPLSQISGTVLRWCAELRRSGGKAAA